MDYEIDLSTLESKKSELGELKTSAEEIFSEFESGYLSTGISGTEISALSNKVKTPIERIKKGMANSDTWYTNYTTELNDLEESLASFSGGSLTAPTEFSGEFTDMFGKVTIPTLQTGGDPHANLEKFGQLGLRGDTAQEQIYNYLASKGFNNAAICGILSNIEHESGFDPNVTGDGGTSYGICQWHNSRWSDLKNYCNNNNLDWKSLEGQLEFLVHELKTSYPGVYNTLQSVPNTSQGAYDAAYKWTTDFEIPDNTESRARTRGSTASSSYWNEWGNKTQ